MTEPLLNLKRPFHKNAVKLFKVIQHIMGDREREKPVNVKLQPDTHISMVSSLNTSTISLASSVVNILEEERWLLTEGLAHGELRDEIFCQVMKQLTSNPSRFVVSDVLPFTTAKLLSGRAYLRGGNFSAFSSLHFRLRRILKPICMLLFSSIRHITKGELMLWQSTVCDVWLLSLRRDPEGSLHLSLKLKQPQ